MAEDKKADNQEAKSDSADRDVQKYLKDVTGDYSGAVDGVNGDLTKQAVKKYQRRQNQYGNFRLDVNGSWDGKTRAHHKWVTEVQTEVAKWKASRRVGTLQIDGDYGHETFTHVKRLQAVNADSFYRKAGGRKVDGRVGYKTAKMLGVKTHP